MIGGFNILRSLSVIWKKSYKLLRKTTSSILPQARSGCRIETRMPQESGPIIAKTRMGIWSSYCSSLPIKDPRGSIGLPTNCFWEYSPARGFRAMDWVIEYLAPKDGKPFPQDEKANDLVQRQTILVSQDADETVHGLAGAKINLVFSGVVANPNSQLGFSKALVVHDQMVM